MTVNRLPEKSSFGAAVDQTQRKPVEERAYREDLATGKKPATPMPMVYGTFNPGDVQAAAGDVNKLPLGGYDPAPMTLTKDANGKDVEGTVLKPSLSATGLVSQSAGAITDYYGLAAARGYDSNANVIDAIRVRANAPGNWKQAQPDVEKLASEIRASAWRQPWWPGPPARTSTSSSPATARTTRARNRPSGRSSSRGYGRMPPTLYPVP